MAKLNIKEALSKMSKFQMIATILLMVSLALLIVQFIAYYLLGITCFKLFEAMFSSFYAFFSAIMVFTFFLFDIAYVAGLLLSLLVGSKRNFAVVLLIKAAVNVFKVLFINPLTVILFKLTYPDGRVGYGGLLFSMFLQITLTAAYCLLAVLLLGGFKKLVKILGFVSAGVMALITIRYIVDFFSDTGDLFDYISKGKVPDILGTLFIDYPQTFAYLSATAAVILVALGFTFAAVKKSAKKPQNSQQAEHTSESEKR